VIIAQTFIVMQKTILAIFIAAEKMIYSSIMQSAQTMILLALYFVMIYFKLGLIHIFGAILAANSISVALTVILLLKKFSLQFTGWHPRQMGYLTKESYVIMISAMLSEGRSYANIFLLKSMSTLNQVSFFQIPHRIITPFQIIPRSIILAIFPTFSQMGSRADDSVALSLIYQSMVKYMTLIFIPICVLLCLGASPIILILFGKPFLASVLPLQICIWGIWFFSLSAIMEDLLIAINKQQLIGIGSVIGLIANVGIAVLLIPEYGASGASVGLVSGNLAQFTVLFLGVRRLLKQVHFFRTIYKIVGAGMLMGATAVICKAWIHLFAALPLSFIIYAGCIYKFNTLTDNEWYYLKAGGLKIKSKILPVKKPPKQI
jgi:O-antigen/teichoic acid export membrane protein